MFAFVITISLVASTLGLFYIYLIWNFGYWKKRGIKEAKSYPLLGSFPSSFMLRRSVTYDVQDIYNKYKRDEHFVGTFNTRVPQLLITSTEYVLKIFVNDFKYFHDNDFSNYLDIDPVFAYNPFVTRGEVWKKQRSAIAPGLTTNRIKSMFAVQQEVCKQFCAYLHKQIKITGKKGLEAKDFCRRFTAEVVSDCVFGIRAGCFSEQPTPVYGLIKRVYDESHHFIFYSVLATMLPLIKKIYHVRFFSKQAEKFFLALMTTAMDLRRNSNTVDRMDFLKYILDLQDNKNFSLADITSLAAIFLTDGVETSAGTLAHSIFLLGRYPEVQEKLRNEIESVGDLTFKNLSKLPYLEACIYEVIRMFPPQLVANKLCTIPYEFVNKDGTKLRIEPNQVVQVPVYALHHDGDIYENPEQFVPERFLEAAGGVKKYQDLGAFLGFGNGPRKCMGIRFAMTQLKTAIAEILMQFTIKVNSKTREDGLLDEKFFMALLKGGIWLDLEPRN